MIHLLLLPFKLVALVFKLALFLVLAAVSLALLPILVLIGLVFLAWCLF